MRGGKGGLKGRRRSEGEAKRDVEEVKGGKGGQRRRRRCEWRKGVKRDVEEAG